MNTRSAFLRTIVDTLPALWAEDPESVQWYASAMSESTGRAAAWVGRYLELRATTDNRPPHGRQAATLGVWKRNQRRARTITLLQQLLLEQLPRWTWSPQQDAWDRRLTLLAEFIDAHDRLPRARAAEPEERALGLWLYRQRRQDRVNNLKHERVVRLRQLVDLDK